MSKEEQSHALPANFTQNRKNLSTEYKECLKAKILILF
jgi:hypothetical protein